MKLKFSKRPVLLHLLVFCIVAGSLLMVGPAFGTPRVNLDTLWEWEEALMPPEHIIPMSPIDGEDYLLDWGLYLEDGDPYPSPTVFLDSQLYVYEGGGGTVDPCTGEPYPYPEDAGLVMAWGDEMMNTGDYTAAWEYVYGEDPDLRNAIIQVTIWPPQFSLNGQVNAVSFGIRDIFGRIRSWWWKCPVPIPWNAPTTITINTSIAGLGAANPPATGYMNTPGFNLAMSMAFIVDENFQWIFGPQPVPPPGQPAFVGMWNYWHNLIVWPVLKPISPTKKGFYFKWRQPPEVFGEDPPKIYGWDELSDTNKPPMVADDWKCTDDRPVTDFHWWGSWLGWDKPYPPPIVPKAFHLGIWTDFPDPDPCDTVSESHPDMLIWEHYCDNYVWNLAGYDYLPLQKIKDNPAITVIHPGVPEDLLGNTWWVRGNSTGIKFTFNGIPASASSHVLVKFNLGVTNHMNGDFGLDGLVDITINPGDPNPNMTYTLKDVLFDNMNPGNYIINWPGPGQYETRGHILVDQKYIQGGMLVVQVDRHTDVKDNAPVAPGGMNLPIDMSKTPPKVPLGCYDFDDAHTVHIGVTATDATGSTAANDEVTIWDLEDINETAFQFTQLLSQEDWFYQEPNDPCDDDPCSTVYWLSIAAIYEPWEYDDPNFPSWGWKTRPHFFNDDAVRIIYVYDKEAGTSVWPPTVGNICGFALPIHDACDVSWDMAFELTTLEEPNIAPWPDPLTWEKEPNALATTVIAMTAATANHVAGVEYYFDETTGNSGGDDSGWQDSSGYTDSGLDPNTTYTYRVKARDKSRNNETAYSMSKSATTPLRSADLFPDGIVNNKDLAIMADRWLTDGLYWLN